MNRVGFRVLQAWLLAASVLSVGACSSESPTLGPQQPCAADTMNDPANCGACGNVCGVGQTCVSGVCQCSGGLAGCPSGCVDVLSDAMNCGGCGLACQPGQVCSLGQCSATCAATLTMCGTSCVDVATSPLHCGICNNPCPAGLSCVGGACACAAGQMQCGTACVDVMSSPTNCGTCNNVCPSGVCQAGQCVGGVGGSGGTGGGLPTGGVAPTGGGGVAPTGGGGVAPTGGGGVAPTGGGGVAPTGGGGAAPTGGVGAGGSGTGATGAGGATLLGGYHVHGEWSGFAFAFATNDATISPDNFEDMVDQDGPYCVTGTVNPSEEYVNIAAFGVNVSQPKIEDAPVNTVTTTGTGLLIDITLNSPESLRIQLEGPDGADDPNQRWCTNITGSQNTVIPWDSFVLECWSGGDETPFNPTADALAKVIVYVPDQGPTGTAQTFDFCVNDIGPDNVTGRGTGEIVASCNNNVTWNGATSTSDQFINIPTSDNAYQFQSNGWGWTGGGHSISLLSSCGFHMDSQSCSRSDYSPCSFPSIYVGTDADGERTGGFTPTAISSIGSIPTCLGWDSGGTPASDEYNVSYDVWFNSNSGANYAETFLMVWFRSPPTFPPAGDPMQDGVVIGDQTWTVWYGPNADGQNVVSYEAPNARANGQAYDFNLKDFIDDAVDRGYLSPSLNLIAIMGGMEIWGGGSGAAITDFRAQVQ